MLDTIEFQILLVSSCIVISLSLVVWFMFKARSPQSFSHKPSDVKTFYNESTDKFLAVYGEIIQAFRTKDVGQYLDYTAKKIGLENHTNVLDAGCGVGGPAIHFAKQFPHLKIDAISISEVQIEKANALILENQVQNQIQTHVFDYHLLADKFPENTYDAIYFLESFGHSPSKEQLLESCIRVVKPGGKIYIKDLFRRVCKTEWEQVRVNEICEDINRAYQYQIADLNQILDIVRKNNLIVHFVGVPEVETTDFENLTISNDFQQLFGIGKIDSWDDYIFPIDFYEILVEKPLVEERAKLHLYVLNNLGEKVSS